MNEIQLIRQQLAVERQHASAVANACANALSRLEAKSVPGGSPLGEFQQACVDYLVSVLARFEERDQRLAELSQRRRPALEEALARRGRSREALEKLEAALGAAAGAPAHAAVQKHWHDFAQFFNSVWSARRDAIDEQLARDTSTADWRLIGGIDADSILEERRRYARVAATVPAGEALTLPAPAREL